MQRINLKKFYHPLYDKDIFIEVSDEVAVAIWEEHRLDDNTRRNLWIHTYSLDESPEMENHFPEQICSAEEQTSTRSFCWESWMRRLPHLLQSNFVV